MTDAREYARALFLITEEDGVTDSVVKDMTALRAVFAENPDYVKLLDTPALEKAERLGLARSVAEKLDWRLANLLMILTEKHLTHLITRMVGAYLDMVDEARGILRADAITAVALTGAQIKALADRLGAQTGKTVVITNTVDESILGGVKLRYAGIQLDGSVKTKLEKFEEGLKTLVL